MRFQRFGRKASAGAVIVALGLMLSACLLTPGKFVSSLDIRKDGAFRFAYSGEMYMLPLSKLAESSGPFKAQPCYKDRTQIERPCTTADMTKQKHDWESKAQKNSKEAASAKALLGGIDPSDPEAAEELVKRLRNQKGWRRVEYRGDGLFDVDFALTGRMGHDFSFPTIERFPMASAFVQVAVHQDGTVRIDAPSFGPSAGAAPFGNMMQAAAMGGASKTADGPNIPEMDGTFTIRTDGEILANNTETGPQPATMGRSLSWKVNSRSTAAPTALIKLER